MTISKSIKMILIIFGVSTICSIISSLLINAGFFIVSAIGISFIIGAFLLAGICVILENDKDNYVYELDSECLDLLED